MLDVPEGNYKTKIYTITKKLISLIKSKTVGMKQFQEACLVERLSE